MKPYATLVGTDGVVELHAVAQVDVNLTRIIHPRHAKRKDSVGLDQALDQLRPLELRVLIVDVFNRNQHLAHRLQVLIFTTVLGFKVFQ